MKNMCGRISAEICGRRFRIWESIVECLHREFEEEQFKNQKSRAFLYAGRFLVSKFRDNEQLLTIYLAEIVDEDDLIIRDSCIEKVEWISLENRRKPISFAC